jgi:hypothetical protein
MTSKKKSIKQTDRNWEFSSQKFFIDGIESILNEMSCRLKDPSMGPILAQRKIPNRVSYLEEFATVKLSLPRRMGNTTILSNLLERFPDSILITYNFQSGQHQFPQIAKEKKFTPRIKNLRGLRTSIVFVDDSTSMSKKDKENIYYIDADFFVLIG